MFVTRINFNIIMMFVFSMYVSFKLFYFYPNTYTYLVVKYDWWHASLM